MDASTGRPGRQAPVEWFKPTNGLVVGWFGVALAVLAIGYAAVAEHSLLGLRIALGAAFVGVLVWVTQLRPRVTAHAETLTVHRPLSDVVLPYLAVDEVTMGQTLNIWSGGRRYVCVGIGKPIGFDTRQRMRAQRAGGQLGGNRAGELSGAGAGRFPAPTYQDFVLSRIGDLVAAARQQPRDASERTPVARVRYAVPELLAIVLTGAGLLASLLV